MPKPRIRVLIEFRISVNTDPDSFTLNDPVKGVLNGDGRYPLGGLRFVPVTNQVQSLSFRRGRTRLLDPVEAATIDITLFNENRKFDPTYTAGPYYPNVVPRRGVQVWIDDVLSFVGQIEDWDFDYPVQGAAVATVKGSDPQVLLARVETVQA